MRGVHDTERLRLDHPGLDTTATRVGPVLVIESDLGTTDAHVVVVRVERTSVTIVYTDVRLERLLFFQGLLDSWEVKGDDTRSRVDPASDAGLYHLARGSIECGEPERVAGFLELVGSRLVFMIDWNRARKRLRRLVGRRAALRVRRRAAENRYGHLAFLRAGGDALYEAPSSPRGTRPAPESRWTRCWAPMRRRRSCGPWCASARRECSREAPRRSYRTR